MALILIIIRPISQKKKLGTFCVNYLVIHTKCSNTLNMSINISFSFETVVWDLIVRISRFLHMVIHNNNHYKLLSGLLCFLHKVDIHFFQKITRGSKDFIKLQQCYDIIPLCWWFLYSEFISVHQLTMTR